MSDSSSAHTSQSAPQGADSRSKQRHRYGGKITSDFDSLKDTAKTTFKGGLDSFGALRRLALAELNLSRHAAGRSVVWVAVSAVFGASTWLLLMTAAVVAMHQYLGWDWLAALMVSAGASAVITVIGVVMMMRFFAHTGFRATKEELARFGIGDEDDDKEHKPSFAALQKRVDRAEAVAEGRRQQTLEAFAATKAQAQAAVTPARILAAGAVSGYVVGRNKVIRGAVRRTGVTTRAAYYTTDTALRGLGEIASLAVSTYAAYKSNEAADSSDEAATAASAAADAATTP